MIKRIKESKALLLISFTILIVVMLLIGKMSYAYFMSQYNTAKTNAGLSFSTLDELKFIKGDDLSLVITPMLLQENAGNLSLTSSSKVTLLANNNFNSAQYSYNLYLNI